MRFFQWLLSLFGWRLVPIEPPDDPVVTVPPVSSASASISPSASASASPSLQPVLEPTLEPPLVIGRGTLNANFLAFAPNWEMGDRRGGDCGLFYYRWPAEKRARFREDYTGAGYTDLPICLMPGGGDLPVTKEASLDLALQLQDELHTSGMRWLHMLITDRGDHPMSYRESVEWAQYIIPRTEADFLCGGWEFPDPTRGGGFAVGDGIEWGWSGDTWKVLDFLGEVRSLSPITPLDLHFRPGWWSTAGPDDTDDLTLWREGRDRGLTFGLLYQPRLNESTVANPDPDDGAAYWAFEHPWSVASLPGIAGRVRYYMGDGSFRYFETARHQTVRDNRMALYYQYSDISGGQG